MKRFTMALTIIFLVATILVIALLPAFFLIGYKSALSIGCFFVIIILEGLLLGRLSTKLVAFLQKVFNG